MRRIFDIFIQQYSIPGNVKKVKENKVAKISNLNKIDSDAEKP